MINIPKLYYSSIGLFFQGSKLYKLDLNDFRSEENFESFSNFQFYIPTENDITLLTELYKNLPGKIDIVKKMFESGNFKCFSYIDKRSNRLAYTRWICTNEYHSEALKKKISLKADEALTLDSYTHPDYRFHGLHRKMNILMIQWLKANTSIRYVYMVILMFIPHLTKIPLELGYKPVESTFYYKKGAIMDLINIIIRKLNA